MKKGRGKDKQKRKSRINKALLIGGAAGLASIGLGAGYLAHKKGIFTKKNIGNINDIPRDKWDVADPNDRMSFEFIEELRKRRRKKNSNGLAKAYKEAFTLTGLAGLGLGLTSRRRQIDKKPFKERALSGARQVAAQTLVGGLIGGSLIGQMTGSREATLIGAKAGAIAGLGLAGGQQLAKLPRDTLLNIRDERLGRKRNTQIKAK